MNMIKLVLSRINRWHVVLAIFFLMESTLIPGRQAGFKCEDPALSHPYSGDTISWKNLFPITILTPLFVVVLVERYHDNTEESKTQAVSWFLEYLFGFLINLDLVVVLKLFVGSPRPHFFDTCEPAEALTCNEYEYVSSYTCLKKNWLTQSDKSFPSGHTSIAAHFAGFLIYYLHKRTSQHSTFTRVLQLLCALFLVACAASRVLDHRHHVGDLVGGVALAAPVLLYTISRCNHFEPPVSISENVETIKTDQVKSN